MRFWSLVALTAAIALIPFRAVAAEQDLLEPEQAFRLSARTIDTRAVEVRYQIAPGYYLYRDKFRFTVDPAEVRVGDPQLPPGKRKKDEFFGEVETYRGELTFRVPVEQAQVGQSVTLNATSQGCADVGVCYVPQDQQVRLTFAAGTTAFASPPQSGLPAGLFGGAAGDGGADDRLVARLFHGSFGILLLSFFGFGLVLSLTPCMLPMIPIVSSVIGGRRAHMSKLQGFSLAAAYVLGMAITYAAAGVLAGLTGAMLSAALQNPWVIGTFAVVFVALAGAMLGFYELQLPAALQTRLATTANRLHGGHFAGVFGMGALSALIVGPCIAAPLAGALLYISQSRDVVLGGAALFTMALGMGVPLLVVGGSAGALLPKTGPWMVIANRFFGILLLGVAVYIASPIMPIAVQMLAWSGVLTIAAVYLRVFESLPARATTVDRVAKGFGMIAMVGAVIYAVGAFSGGRDVLQPLSGVFARTADDAAGVAFKRVSTRAELDEAIAASKGRPVMLDFYADWCVTCKEMERYTFTDRRVRERLDKIEKLQADVTANSAEHQALLKRFSLFGPPGIIFFDGSGREMNGLRVIGYQTPERFTVVLDQVLSGQ